MKISSEIFYCKVYLKRLNFRPSFVLIIGAVSVIARISPDDKAWRRAVYRQTAAVGEFQVNAVIVNLRGGKLTEIKFKIIKNNAVLSFGILNGIVSAFKSLTYSPRLKSGDSAIFNLCSKFEVLQGLLQWFWGHSLNCL